MGADDGGLMGGVPLAGRPKPVEFEKPQGTLDSPGSIPNVDSPTPSSDEEVKRFSPPGVKLTIGSLDKTNLKVSAQYNPKELQVDRMIPWQARMSPEVDRLTLEYTGEEGRTLSIELLFDGYEENLSIRDEIDKLERMSRANIAVDRRQSVVSKYDAEAGAVVSKDTDPGMEDPGELVVPGNLSEKEKGEAIVKHTQQQAQYREYVEAKNKEKEAADKKGMAKRPHLCAVTWGDQWLSEPLMCVIDSIRTRYSMFSDTGVPLRATVTLMVKEAHALGVATEQDRLTYQQRLRNQLIDEHSPLNQTRLERENMNLRADIEKLRQQLYSVSSGKS